MRKGVGVCHIAERWRPAGAVKLTAAGILPKWGGVCCPAGKGETGKGRGGGKGRAPRCLPWLVSQGGGDSFAKL